MKLQSKKSEKVVLFERNKADLVQISVTCDTAHKTSTKFDLDKKKTIQHDVVPDYL